MNIDEEKNLTFWKAFDKCLTIDEKNDLIQGFDLTNLRFSVVNLSGLNFSNKDMSGCMIVELLSSNVNFKEVDLYNAFIFAAGLYDCNFEGAKINCASISEVGFHKSSFKDAEFGHTNTFANFEGCNIKNTLFTVNSKIHWSFTDTNILSADGDIVQTLEEWDEFFKKKNTVKSNIASYYFEDAESSYYGVAKSAYEYLKAIRSTATVEDSKDWHPEYKSFKEIKGCC